MVVIAVYLAPRLGAQDLLDFDNFITSITQLYPNAPMILMGDFNARDQQFGDHANCQDPVRRDWIRTLVNDGFWNFVAPTQGKWTSVTETGHGIPDLVFVNDVGKNRVSNLQVLEHDSTVLSDHRPIIFTVLYPDGLEKPPFTRTNIRNLLANCEDFISNLVPRCATISQLVDEELMNANNKWREHSPISWEDRRSIAGKIATELSTALVESAREIAGILQFRGGCIHAPMRESHVAQIRAIVVEACKNASESVVGTVGHA
ncbi:hypothetical protein HDU81_001632, partial [Chytriomyces hyalinus]